MTAAALPFGPAADPPEADNGLAMADLIEESMLLLGAGSTVLYQLAVWGVGRGVADHTTTLQRPIDRLRTTLTYVYVLVLGTAEERAAVARMVNRAHAKVRGEGYTAFDRDLQLWVAATLAWNGTYIYEKVHGPLPLATKERLYRESWIFGTALQVREEDWPPTYADFLRYWDDTLADGLRSDPVVHDFVRRLLSTQGQPWYLKPAIAVQNLITRGNLTPEVRTVLGLTWTWREQRVYDLFWAVHNLLYPLLPGFVRKAHARLVLRDFRRRMRKGLRVI